MENQRKTLVLFDVDGTLTVPRKVLMQKFDVIDSFDTL